MLQNIAGGGGGGVGWGGLFQEEGFLDDLQYVKKE